MILANGADLRSTNRFGGTALIPAAEKGHPEAVAMLIAAGVDVNHEPARLDGIARGRDPHPRRPDL